MLCFLRRRSTSSIIINNLIITVCVCILLYGCFTFISFGGLVVSSDGGLAEVFCSTPARNLFPFTDKIPKYCLPNNFIVCARLYFSRCFCGTRDNNEVALCCSWDNDEPPEALKPVRQCGALSFSSFVGAKLKNDFNWKLVRLRVNHWVPSTGLEKLSSRTSMIKIFIWLAIPAYQLQWILTCCREMKWKTSRHLMTIELFIVKCDLIGWWISNLALVLLRPFDYAADTVQWVAKPKKKENLSDGSLWACSPFSTESVTQKHSKPKWLAINKSKNAPRKVAQMKITKIPR